MEKRSRQRVRDQVAYMAFGAEKRMRSNARGAEGPQGLQTVNADSLSSPAMFLDGDHLGALALARAKIACSLFWPKRPRGNRPALALTLGDAHS